MSQPSGMNGMMVTVAMKVPVAWGKSHLTGLRDGSPGRHAPLIVFSNSAIRFRMSSKLGGGSSNIIGAIFR
jgi:hypothetical protein